MKTRDMRTLRWNNFLLAFIVATMPFLASCGDDTSTSETTEEHATNDELSGNEEPMMQVVTFENTDQQVRSAIDELVTTYLELKDALVATSADEAKAKANNLREKAANINTANLIEEQKQFLNERLTEIRENSEKIANAADVEEQRNAFYPLSESIYKTVKAFGASDEQLYVQYCPMAFDNEGAWWLSSNQEIRNPYFGDKMLKCGSVKERINVQ